MAAQVRKRQFTIEECYRMAKAGILSMSDLIEKVAKRRFGADEYYRLAQAGILSEDDRVELIKGEIVEMSPIGSRHAACVSRLNRAFSARVGSQAIVSVQNPIRLDDLSEPVPDIALLRPRPDYYSSAHPGPADILLVIEVADTSLSYDRDVKLPLYARSGIPEAWLVDLESENIQVCRAPSPGGYKDVQILRRGQSVAPVAVPGLRLAVADILG